MKKKSHITDPDILRLVLTGKQYKLWEIKKKFINVHRREAKQCEIAILMGISQQAVSRLQKRISEKLMK